MIKFASEWIVRERTILNMRQNKYDWNNYKSLEALDKIERLQARIAELEARISAYEEDDPYLAIRYQSSQDEK